MKKIASFNKNRTSWQGESKLLFQTGGYWTSQSGVSKLSVSEAQKIKFNEQSIGDGSVCDDEKRGCSGGEGRVILNRVSVSIQWRGYGEKKPRF
jgi:hypothetical protein